MEPLSVRLYRYNVIKSLLSWQDTRYTFDIIYVFMILNGYIRFGMSMQTLPSLTRKCTLTNFIILLRVSNCLQHLLHCYINNYNNNFTCRTICNII